VRRRQTGAEPTRERAIRVTRDAGVSNAAENAAHVVPPQAAFGPARKSNCRVLDFPQTSCTPARRQIQAPRPQIGMVSRMRRRGGSPSSWHSRDSSRWQTTHARQHLTTATRPKLWRCRA